MGLLFEGCLIIKFASQRKWQAYVEQVARATYAGFNEWHSVTIASADAIRLSFSGCCDIRKASCPLPAFPCPQNIIGDRMIDEKGIAAIVINTIYL